MIITIVLNTYWGERMMPMYIIILLACLKKKEKRFDIIMRLAGRMSKCPGIAPTIVYA
jgi:hypothetical protein